jgi:hypothetical protein
MDVEEIKKKKSELEDVINGKLHAFSKECGVDVTKLILEKQVFNHWKGVKEIKICIYEARLVVEI